MNSNPLTWAIVDAEAEALGAEPEARRKWRQPGRGVPSDWKLRLIESLGAKGLKVVAADFDALPVNPGRIAA